VRRVLGSYAMPQGRRANVSGGDRFVGSGVILHTRDRGGVIGRRERRRATRHSIGEPWRSGLMVLTTLFAETSMTQIARGSQVT